MAQRRGILGVKDPSDYTAIVKRKPGLLNKWRWEIHRDSRSSPVKVSGYVFTSMSSAKRAADEALSDYLRRANEQHPLV